MNNQQLTVLGEVHGSEKMVIDLTGKVFGRLTVIDRAPNPTYRRQSGATWTCRCTCGKVVDVAGVCLRRGATKSCGCLRADLNREKLARMHEKKRERKAVQTDG